MSVYLVRLSENKEIVGLFWAPNIVELAWAIDECCDPWSCDFKKIVSGGIFWSSKVDVSIPNEISDHCDDGGISFAKGVSDTFSKLGIPQFSERLFIQEMFPMAGKKEKGWRKFNLPYERFLRRA